MNKVRFGVIGAGGIADRRTIPGLLLCKNAELAAVMEVDMAAANRLKEKYGAKYAYDDVGALLANREVDAVYIASPVAFHYGHAVEAAKAKKHVLVEKPATLTFKQTCELDSICKEEGVLAACGLMMRFHAYHQAMRDLVHDGKLGQIVSCRAQLTCWYPDIQGAWRQKKSESGGGALMDLGIHCIDLLQYITGGQAAEVAAFIGTKTFQYDVDDSASVLFTTDTGANCYVDVNFNIPDEAAKCNLEIYGTKGSAMATGTISQVEGGDLNVYISDSMSGYDAAQNRNNVMPLKIDVQFSNMYTKEIDSFADSILNGTPVEVPLSEAAAVQAVCEAAYASAEMKKAVSLEKIRLLQG